MRGYYVDLRFHSKGQGSRSKKDEKKSLSQYMNPSTSDKSSVFSNEERKLSDIELGSVKSKGSKGSRRSGKHRNKSDKRDSSGSRRRESELSQLAALQVQSPPNESRRRASSGAGTDFLGETRPKSDST